LTIKTNKVRNKFVDKVDDSHKGLNLLFGSGDGKVHNNNNPFGIYDYSLIRDNMSKDLALGNAKNRFRRI
jgi:hypothetical protein